MSNKDLCQIKTFSFRESSRLDSTSEEDCNQNKSTLIACPSAWSIRVSFFYVPKNYPKRIREKKQSPWTIQILSQIFFLNLAMFKIFSMSQKLSGEKNTLNYSNSIRFFLDSSKNIEFFCHFYVFQKIWQCLSLCFCQAYRLTIAGCIKEMTMFKNFQVSMKKILTPWTIRLVSVKKTKHFELSDTSGQIFSDTWNIY